MLSVVMEVERCYFNVSGLIHLFSFLTGHWIRTQIQEVTTV